MKKRIKLGQIGIGHNHGADKMLAFRKYPEKFDIVGFAEADTEWLKKRGNLPSYRGRPLLTADRLIDECDAILIETDVPYLTRTAAMCVERGKHIHMDKPASGTLEEFKYVLDTAKDKQLVVQMGYMYRYNPAIQKTFDTIPIGKRMYFLLRG